MDESVERWRRVSTILADALELEPAERAAWLERACRTEPELRAEVEALLAAAEGPTFLDASLDAFASPLLAGGRARPEAAAPSASDGGGPPGADARLRELLADLRRAEPSAACEMTAQLQAALGGAYLLERELGGGGMSRVFVAEEVSLGRRVVVKVLPPELASVVSVERFRREVAIVAQLRHPHIVPLLTAGVRDGLLFYTMPFVEGETLRARLDRRDELSVTEAVALLREVADALAYAHRRGVVHRDLKPQNILLGEGHAHVADFGVAKALSAATARHGNALTSTGVVLGTPAYMSPEQAAGEPVDTRTDLYALGVVACEVLAGQPPFAERSAPRLRSARRQLAPEELLRRRPGVPRPLAALVMRLLESDPADRPADADEVVRWLAALPAAGAARPPRLGTRFRPPAPDALRRRLRGAGAAAGLVVAGFAAWWMLPLLRAPPHLDPNRIVVFPLRVEGAGLPRSAGEDVATLVGHVLDGTEPLQWIEATDHLRSPPRRPERSVAEERREISRALSAGFFIHGSAVRHGDSILVGLQLHSVAGDSLVARGRASGTLTTTPVELLALQAIGGLLVPLLASGRRVDLSALGDRKPAAIANFLLGERAYRASHFERALERYQAALAEDSLFVLAALKGAQAASWLDRTEEAARLVRLALEGVQLLPSHRASFARGLHHYLTGTADSAVAEFTRVIEAEAVRGELRSEPWMALGEVYRHLLPQAADLDSLAEDAFARARQVDTAFTPPLYHLAELALRRGALARADTLVREYKRVNPDRSLNRPLDLMLRCVRSGPAAVEWRPVAEVDSEAVVHAGVLLAGGAAHPPCARAALRAALDAGSATESVRWSALFALQSLLLATGRDAEALELLQHPAVAARDAERLLLLDASALDSLASPTLRARAAEVAGRMGDDYGAMRPYVLWLLGSWEADRGRADRVRDIASALAAKSDSSRQRSDAVRAEAIAARAALLSGDTALAIRRLRALTPSAPRDDLLWYAWEGLGGERLLLAKLLLAQRDHEGAQRVAAQLDGSHPVAYLLFLRPSLLLRARAAEARGDAHAAARFRERLARLSRDATPLPGSTSPSTPNRSRG